MRVAVACAPPGDEAMVEVDLPSGATVADAVARSALVARLRLEAPTLAYAIFGQKARPDTPLCDGDRVEILLPLRVDPKVARRLRAARTTGARRGGSRTGPGNGG